MVADVLLKLASDNKGNKVKWMKYVKSDWFTDTVDALIWKEMTKCLEEYGSVPSLDLIEAKIKREESDKVFEKVEQRLAELKKLEYNEVDEKVVEDLLKEIIEKESVSQMIERGAELVELGKVKDIWGLVDDVKLNLSRMNNIHVPELLIAEKAVLNRYVMSIMRNEDDAVGTLIRSLDRVLKGGFRKGTLTVVLGITSIGKTMFLVYLSAAIALQGATVLYISLEDTKETIDERFDSLWFGDCSLEEKLAKRKLLENLGAIVYSEFNGELSVNGVKELVNKYKENGIVPEVVIIDYGDLMVYEGKHKEEHQELGDIFEKLMKYAENEDIVIITASQGNREGLGKKVISLKHMGGSFRKAQIAHYVLGICQTEEEEEKNLIRLAVLKNKFGRRNVVISCEINRERQFYKELSSIAEVSNKEV